jgi:hypothetical protein
VQSLALDHQGQTLAGGYLVFKRRNG